MNGLKQAKKGTTLRRRLIFFFVAITVSLILLFALLLCLLGITGKEEKALHHYVDNTLDSIAGTMAEDFGQLAVDGIYLSEQISETCDTFWEDRGIRAEEWKEHPELISELLSETLTPLLSLATTRSCGGTFLVLDATVNSKEEGAELSRAGIFIKKTQPVYTRAVVTKLHYLRGPAQVARDHGVELMAQWKMEYDLQGEEFLLDVMETARENPDLSLSRLYYWSGRVQLEGNSEEGFLLSVPLRSGDGTVFGVCGIEVSDRMFKSLYSPSSSSYDEVFVAAAPMDGDMWCTSKGIVAGNSYLTGQKTNENVSASSVKNGFEYYCVGESVFGGKSEMLRLYPELSPYSDLEWRVALLMPERLMNQVIVGSMPVFIIVVISLLILSAVISVAISHQYLRPVTNALDSIRSSSYEDGTHLQFLEISDLIEFLAGKDREYEETIQRLDQEKQNVQSSYDMAQTYISHLADQQMPQVNRDNYDAFLECLHTLTPKENEIFELYLAGKSAKEIMELLGISQNTLKYHNKNIYSKLGVTSRKQLLEYAALMKVKA